MSERVKRLEERPAWVYRGTWEAGEYLAGHLVTDRGSLWFCRETTIARPGEPALASRAWQLIAKRGADGRDGKNGKDSTR